MVCLGVVLLGFILFGTFCASCSWIFVPFFRFGKFPAILSSNICFIVFSFLLLESLQSRYWHILYYSIDLLNVSFIFFMFFLSAILINFHYFIFHIICICVILSAIAFRVSFISEIELPIFD